MFKALRQSPTVTTTTLSLVREVEFHGLEGRGIAVTHATIMDLRCVPGFPGDMPRMLAYLRGWINYHQFGG